MIDKEKLEKELNRAKRMSEHAKLSSKARNWRGLYESAIAICLAVTTLAIVLLTIITKNYFILFFGLVPISPLVFLAINEFYKRKATKVLLNGVKKEKENVKSS